MGWVWKEDSEAKRSFDASEFENSNPRSYDQCSTRKIVKSQCKTEEVEPGKFVRKCEKTEEIFRDCVGRATEVVQSNKEYTEEDVTDQMKNGSSPVGVPDLGPFDFPGLRSDIEAMERSIFGGLSRFFEAAEDMKNEFFGTFGSPHFYEGDSSSSVSRKHEIPIEGVPKEASPNPCDPRDPESAIVDLSGMARDV